MSFTSEGNHKFPHLQSDYEQVIEYATWPTEALQSKQVEYSAFLDEEFIMPRALTTAQKVLSHVIFELDWRENNE